MHRDPPRVEVANSPPVFFVARHAVDPRDEQPSMATLELWKLSVLSYAYAKPGLTTTSAAYPTCGTAVTASLHSALTDTPGTHLAHIRRRGAERARASLVATQSLTLALTHGRTRAGGIAKLEQ